MFELRDKIRELDVATDMKFDLLGLYEMSELTDAEKKLMATIIHTAENEEKAAEEVFEILNTPNAVNMDEDCEPERKLKEVFHPAYEELQNGDEIIVNGQHLYVADAEYADDYVWVTDEKEDRYNKRAPGNTLAKYMIDDVIGQPDDDDEEGDAICPKCNKTPYQLANERRKNESLNQNELEELFKLCDQLGIHTLGDLELFMKNEGKGKAILSALKDYLFFEIGDPDFQAKDESLKESEDSQFDKAVEAMKAYWNYQMSLEQLHNTLLKIYNNDAEKAFKVFVEYGDAARRSKDECLNCDPKEENVPTVKEEVLKEDTDAEEWEEVATKTVEDSDGFLTDYVWYTNGDKHVFIFGDSDICRPEDGYFDWEVDIVEGKEAEAYKEAQGWFNSYNGFADENLNEANYGGAFDIRPDEYFTRDDINDAAEKVADEINNKVSFTDEVAPEFEVTESWFEDNNFTVRVVDKSDSSEYEKSIHIDMRKIKRPNDLADKYGPELAQMLVDEITYSKTLDEAQDIYDIQGQAVRDSKRKEVLDEFKEIFTDEPGGINLDNEETLAIVRGYLEDMGYIVEVSETQNASHPIHIEWFK